MGSSTNTNTTSSTEQFNIRWKNYTTVLHSVFRDLLEQERLVDITLACEGGFIKCHRIILCACSSYFENLLNELHSEPHLVIFMKDLKLWELQALIHFMYNGEVSVRQNRLAPLVRAAESLHIRGLSTESDDKPRGRNSFDPAAEEGDEESAFQDTLSTNQKKVIPRTRAGLGQNKATAAAPIQSAKRSSTTSSNGVGGGVVSPPKKQMRRFEQNKPSTSTSSNLTNRPRTILSNSRRTTVDSLDATGVNEGDMEGEEGEEYVDRSSEDINVEGEEGDDGEMVIAEEAYCDDTYDDGTSYPEDVGDGTTAYAPIETTHRPTPPLRIVDPPITGPVVDAADRANRLKKATDLALSGITVRQSAAHYGIPRTTLCAYMKRRGFAGKRLVTSGGGGNGGNYTYQLNQPIDQNDDEENEFPFMSGLADLVKGQGYEIQQDS